MKGKCFMPGAITIPDKYNFVIFSRFDDFGCLVKNRRGKHRVRKRHARVEIALDWIVKPRSRSPLRRIRVGARACGNARRCRASVEKPLPDGTPLPRPWKVVGLVAHICGQRTMSHKFKKPRLARGAPRVDWCLNWGRDCGRPAANAFCRRKGYDRAKSFRKDPSVKTTTLVQGARRTCNGRARHCDAFKRIRCTRRGDATAFTVNLGRTPGRGGVRHIRRGLRRCSVVR
jgi:hypothetical protein